MNDEERVSIYEQALRAIAGPCDDPSGLDWRMAAYREAGGGYEGLQAIADYIELERRVLDAERELRSIRAALAKATRCICPVGFGAQPNPDCPKHGTA